MRSLLSNSPAERRLVAAQYCCFQWGSSSRKPPVMTEALALPETLSLARRTHKRPGLIINPTTHMAWRPYENLIDGELDNRVPGTVRGWMRFFRSGKRPLKVTFDLVGDFHEDIRGKVIRLSNPGPLDRNQDLDRNGTYMKGFASMQRGNVGDITAGLSLGEWTEDLAQELLQKQEAAWEQTGVPAIERERRRQALADLYRFCIDRHELYYPYVAYPYIEWYSASNGRVVLELDSGQLEILGDLGPWQRIPEEPEFEERSAPPKLDRPAGSAELVSVRESSRRNASTPEADKVN